MKNILIGSLIFVVACSKSSLEKPASSIDDKPMPKLTQDFLKNTSGKIRETVATLNFGDDKGNGGDAVVCFSDDDTYNRVKNILINNKRSSQALNPFEDETNMSAVSSIQMLDFYEYQLPAGFPPIQHKILPIQESFVSFINNKITEMSSKSGLADELKKQLASIPLNRWRAAPGVVEIDDSDSAVTLPNGCLLVQMAVRKSEQVYYDKFLFTKLDETNRAGLVFHELIYKFSVENGATNSRHSREVVGLLMGDEWTPLLPIEIHQQLRKIGRFDFPLKYQDQLLWVHEFIEAGEWFSRLDIKTKEIRIDKFTFQASSLFFDEAKEIIGVDGRIINHPRVKATGLFSLIAKDVWKVSKPKEFGNLEKNYGTLIEEATIEVDFLRSMKLGYGNSFYYPTRYGDIKLNQSIFFYPQSEQPTLFENASGLVLTKYDRLYSSGAISFYPNGVIEKLIQANTPNSFSSNDWSCYDSGNFMIAKSPVAMSAYICGGNFKFTQDGEVDDIDAPIYPRHPLAQRITVKNEKPNSFIQANGFAKVSFYPGIGIKQIIFERIGSMQIGITTTEAMPGIYNFDQDGHLVEATP
jgi:hypothetical protein